MKHSTALQLCAGMILASLSAANAGTPDALIQAHHQRCGKPGAEHKEMDITVPAHATTYTYQNNQVISLQEFTIQNGDTSYQVSAGTNDEGKPSASLDVYQGTPETGKHLADIQLAPDTVVNNISHALTEEGVAESDSL
ncbi:hypothetical protein HL670_03398 [Serratia plymuthica]|uniref:hypothetical protein n=1 Tax=Serratia plymuthica TaxID=82996 RepID=UPI00034C40CC|nr:hypothetical protein [Serratia plymuthica]QJW56502.1 hypothetical protein HL670_03398 [Serratia plymuthica]